MSNSTDKCETVSPSCPVEDTTYGYTPNLGGNAVYAVVFAACALVQLVFLFRHWRLWKGYTFLVLVACVGECCGYVGRILLHNNPWDGAAMSIQFLLLMVAPSFMAAALYMTLRTLVEFFGPEHSKVPTKFWTWPFVTADFVGFLLQCGGGIMASMAEKTPSLGTAGTVLMITGVTLQALVMAIAGALGVDFVLRAIRRRGVAVISTLPRNLKVFLTSMAVTLLLILARCIYRIPELAEGIGGPLMRKEAEFMVFDGLLIVVSATLFTLVHPGRFAAETRHGAKYTYQAESGRGYELCNDSEDSRSYQGA